MKTKLLYALTSIMLLSFSAYGITQAPTLGTSGDFVLFTTIGAVSNTGISHITGNVGSNNGAITAFGNINGVMHNADGASAQCAADLLTACDQIDNAVPDYFPAPVLGNGTTLTAGVYKIEGDASLNLDLTLDAEGDANAVFIFKIQGAFSTAANSSILLTNGALACNVFWKVEGLVSMASNTSMKGTVIANNAAIEINTGGTLEGRALSTSGAITIDGVLAYIPTGCGSTILSGPEAPTLASLECYAILTANGELTNTGISYITGDVGTNVGLTSGFDSLTVSGTIHPIPDVSTAECAADLLIVYSYLNLLPYDIELLHPELFGNNLVLTPHTYFLDAATIFTDSLYLDARGNADAVFVIQINGALSTSTHSKVLLINGTQAKNVYWKVEGALSVGEYSIFNGNIICNNGAVSLLSGVTLNGRVFSVNGSISVAASTVTMPEGCNQTNIPPLTTELNRDAIGIAPNPFSAFTNIYIKDASQQKNYELRMYNVLGKEVIRTIITSDNTTLETSHLRSGLYLYKISANNEVIKSGKLISKGTAN